MSKEDIQKVKAMLKRLRYDGYLEEVGLIIRLLQSLGWCESCAGNYGAAGYPFCPAC